MSSITPSEHAALENSPFYRVPDEVTLHIFGFLSTKDLATVARVCKYFNRLSKDDSIFSKKIVVNGTSYICNLKTCTIQISPKQLYSADYRKIFRTFITEIHPSLNASYYAFFPYYFFITSFRPLRQCDYHCISAEKKDGTLLTPNEFSLESSQLEVTPPEGVNINLLLSKSQRIKFSGSELDQQQLEEEKLMNLWAEHLISQELEKKVEEKKESTKP